MKITAQMVLDKDPCEEWTKERLKEKLGKGKTLLQILDMDDVDAGDRIWCVTRFPDDKTNRKFAIWCARQCKTGVKKNKEYIDVIERYYNDDATEEEMDAAYWAAHSAAYRVAYSAADSAASYAARKAARGAEYSAARGAAYSAAFKAAYWAAYWAADSNEIRQKQIKKLKELVKEEK